MIEFPSKKRFCPDTDLSEPSCIQIKNKGFYQQMGVSKNRVFLKMDGENNGKPD